MVDAVEGGPVPDEMLEARDVEPDAQQPADGRGPETSEGEHVAGAAGQDGNGQRRRPHDRDVEHQGDVGRQRP
jgi:hypothetical protein